MHGAAGRPRGIGGSRGTRDPGGGWQTRSGMAYRHGGESAIVYRRHGLGQVYGMGEVDRRSGA